MAASFTKWFPSGYRLINGATLSNWFNNPQNSYQDAITAFAGGGQASAVQLSAAKNRVSVVANNGDSVKLPKSSATIGGEILIINDGVSTLAVFPYDAAIIDGGAAAASVNIGAGKRAFFWTVGTGAWESGVMAKTS